MVGYISEGVAKAIRSWDRLRSLSIVPVRATDGTSAVVNTPLPAVAIHVLGEDGEGNTFLGGEIRQYFELSLYCMIPITDYSFSTEKGTQTELLDASDEIIRCMERTRELDALKIEHDFNMQFDRMDSDTTYATQGVNSITVDVHKIVYKCSVRFNPYGSGEQEPIDPTLENVSVLPKNKVL